MKNCFKVKNILIRENRVEYDYEISGPWKRYFNLNNRLYVEYSMEIEEVPKSVAVIPLLCMVLPISWICNACVYVGEIDKDYYDNIENIKSGFQKMYPMLKFNGRISGYPIKSEPTNRNVISAAFFSGGVDAFHTMIRHINEKPALITVWGADVQLTDHDGWEKVRKHIQSVGEEFGLSNIYIKSNFRIAIYENKLWKLVKAGKDSWWHGFYCGIGIIGLASVCTYVMGFKNLYVASSFPEFMKGKYTCGSDPTIDNFVNFCGCRTRHDGYEFDRQNKVRELSKYMREKKRALRIRVCWSSIGGGNCCECEKCYRTIMEFVSEGINPNTIGFLWNEEKKELFKKNMMNSIIISENDWTIKWVPIQKRLLINKIDIKEYDWLIDLSYEKFMSAPIKKIKLTMIYRLWIKVLNILKFHNMK